MYSISESKIQKRLEKKNIIINLNMWNIIIHNFIKINLNVFFYMLVVLVHHHLVMLDMLVLIDHYHIHIGYYTSSNIYHVLFLLDEINLEVRIVIQYDHLT
jgi:hypothetical protein